MGKKKEDSKFKKIMRSVLSTVAVVLLVWAFLYIENNYLNKPDNPDPENPTATIDERGEYTSKEDVALYIHTYNHLPDNFITKSEAKKLGWSGGGLDKYKKNGCIGGDRFGNNEGLLPKKDGRIWYECDIDTMNQKSRGSKRIVFSNDGLIFYTEDHYSSFEQLYGE